VSLSARDTHEWAHKAGASWPCSTLADRAVWAQLDKRNGDLVDLQVNGRTADDGGLLVGEPPSLVLLDGHELDAILADLAYPKARARGWGTH